MKAWLGRTSASPGDEVHHVDDGRLASWRWRWPSINRLLKLGLLSRLAEQVTFVLIPPLVLIFLVLGTIFLGVATPTEGGAMGALGR
jgi:TRAP-type mannitol/chloroaromatic compound transport system permease large subunit